jgi:hypothetical protein
MTARTIRRVKRGMLNRVKQPLIRGAMRVVTAQAGGPVRLQAVMNIAETGCLVIVAGEAEFFPGHVEKRLIGTAMGKVAKPTILTGRGMGHPFLPILLDILMTTQAEIRLLFHEQMLVPGAVGHMAHTALHGRYRGMEIGAPLNQLLQTLMTGEAEQPLGLAQGIRIITGMGVMAGLALALHKGWVAMLLFLLLGSALVTAETELSLMGGRL